MSRRGRAPFGPNHPNLPPIKHRSKDVWQCRVCHYWPNVDKVSRFCLSCGRDFWGNPGHVPKEPKRRGDGGADDSR